MVGEVQHVRGPRTAEGKLRPPSLTGQVVSRPRLIDALDSGLDATGTFLMLSAPAGFGKTYLLSQWFDLLVLRGTSTGWCTLTVDDRDPRVLWHSILDTTIHAVRCKRPDLAQELERLEPPLNPLEHASFLATLYAVIADYDDIVVLVYDDAGVLDHSAAEFEFIQFLLGMPDNLRIAFATRSSLQTHSARVSGRLLELSADALSFSRAEAGELFAMRGFGDADPDKLFQRAEGWPAALSLALLSAKKRADAPSVIDDWDDPSVLFDYLRTEVFTGLSADEQRVLLTMGVTPNSTAELVEALGGGEDSAALIRRLASDNRLLYRVSVDVSGRTWYRVQHLFGRFLNEQLRELHPKEFVRMSERAIGWHLSHGDPFVALSLALALPSSSFVDEILRRRGYELISDGHSRKLLAMVPAATDEVLRGPFARLMLAYAAVSAAKPERAEEILAAPRVDDLSVDDLLEWDWLNYLVRMTLALSRGVPNDQIVSGWDERSLADVYDPLRLAIRLTRGLAEAKQGKHGRATDDLRAALALAENDEDLSVMVLSTAGLAGAAASENDFHTALSLSEQALDLACRSTTQHQEGTRSVTHVIAAWCCFEKLDTASARHHAVRAVELAADLADPQLALQAQHMYNDTHFEVLPQKRRVAQDFVTVWPPPYLLGASSTAVISSALAGMRMAAHLGEPRWSERLLDRARQLIGEGYDWQVAYALHLLHIGRDDAARTIIAPLVETDADGVDERSRPSLSSVLAHSIDAVLKSRANNAYRAHAAIYHALELADATGAYAEVSRSDRPTIARILAAGSDRFGPHEHIARLLLAGDTGESVLTSGPLTARERQILGELRTLRTVDEIAHDLLLSVNTVKTHMRGIYRKLDVASRRQAVVKAERYGLI